MSWLHLLCCILISIQGGKQLSLLTHPPYKGSSKDKKGSSEDVMESSNEDKGSSKEVIGSSEEAIDHQERL